MPNLAITPGDPRGVGPEVVCKALLDRQDTASPIRATVFGDLDAFRSAAKQAGLVVDALVGRGELRLVSTVGADEPVEVNAIRQATDRVMRGELDALVTGPIHKHRLARQGFGFPGHTDFLGHLCGVDRPVMAFVGGSVRVALVTVHLPLRQVPDAVKSELIVHTIRAADSALRNALGLADPRLVVCGLNPHAGDGGLLGSEDANEIAPAVAAAVAHGIYAIGPVSAEAAFRQAVQGQADMVIAMYHDQGLAPLKALDFGRSVNWTLGLPIIRTSVDHGTADDIAGRGVADPASMLAAIALAEQLAQSRTGSKASSASR